MSDGREPREGRGRTIDFSEGRKGLDSMDVAPPQPVAGIVSGEISLPAPTAASLEPAPVDYDG